MFFKKVYQTIKYVIKDYIAYLKNPYEKLWQVHGYIGDVGQGKTLSAIAYAKKMKEKDPRIKVFTNCYAEFQDGQITHWSDLLQVPSYSIIIIDEIQNTFMSRNFKNLPIEMISLLTQNRKWGIKTDEETGERRPPGVQFIYTTQDWENVDIMFRRLTNYCYDCSAFFSGRMIFNRKYHRKQYEKPEAMRKREGLTWWVGTDEIRNAYNTHKLLGSLKSEAEMQKDAGKNSEVVINKLAELLNA